MTARRSRSNAHGSVEFTDDETDVQKVSPGGYITIEKSNGRWLATDSQKFDAREKNGTIVRTYYVERQGDERRGGPRVAEDVPPGVAA